MSGPTILVRVDVFPAAVSLCKRIKSASTGKFNHKQKQNCQNQSIYNPL